MAGAVEVFEAREWGSSFVIPIGMDKGDDIGDDVGDHPGHPRHE